MDIKDTNDALHRGIAMVHQVELQPIPDRSIAEIFSAAAIQ
ncbi:MAG: hypothetical protein ACLSA6_06310 [Holdemania massiliensis]